MRKSHQVLRDSYLLVTGSLPEGFTFYGPFKDQYEAGTWAQDNLREGTPHTVHLMQDVREPEGGDD